MDKTEFIEAIKEGLRVAALAILPILITMFNTQTGKIAIDWRLIIVVGVVAILRFIDSALHRYGKEVTATLPKSEVSKLEGGLTRF